MFYYLTHYVNFTWLINLVDKLWTVASFLLLTKMNLHVQKMCCIVNIVFLG